MSAVAQAAYEDGNEYVNNLQLPEGRHTFYFFDEYGDGWSEADMPDSYWQIEDARDGTLIAGGLLMALWRVTVASKSSASTAVKLHVRRAIKTVKWARPRP